MVVVLLSCAWVAGILVGSFFRLSPLLYLVGIPPLVLWLVCRGYRKAIALAGLLVIVLVSGAIYSYTSLNEYDAGDLRSYNDSGTVEMKGTVGEAPDVRDSSTRIVLSSAVIFRDGVWLPVDGQALVFLPRFPTYDYGDVLRVTGEPTTPPQLGDFDYRGYLEHRGIHTLFYYPEIEVVETGTGFPPLAWVYGLRQGIADSLTEILPEPQAALAQRMVVGMRGNIPADLREDFSRSGTSHLLAISGLHLGIVAGVMLSLGLWIFGRRRYYYVWLALVAVWFYTVITGMNPPVVRGAIMASVFLLAEIPGRQRSGIVALTLAAAIMVGIHPYILGDASFQLSFLAMAGLVFLFPLFRDAGRGLTARIFGESGRILPVSNAAVDALSATLAAVIAIWPVVAYYFGIVSLVGPLATFLALPAVPVIILLGAAAGIFGLFLLPVAQFFAWLAWPFLSYLILVVTGLAAPAVSSIEVSPFPPFLIIIYYVLLAAALWYINRRRRRTMASGTVGGMGGGFNASDLRKWLVAPLAVLAFLVAYIAFTLPDSRLQVSFLDIGEGDAILIQQGSRQVLVDGGPSPQSLTVALGRQMPFWDRTIELVVLTHPHQDHLAGLVEVLRRYRVGLVIQPEIDYSSPLYAEWQRLISTNTISVNIVSAGQQIELGDGIIISVLNPGGESLVNTYSDIDNNSLVLRVSYDRVSFLLTSDIMGEGEMELLRTRADLDTDVLKVAHHGSDTSSLPGFLAVASPRVAVISSGIDNRYGHPDGEVVLRLEETVGEDHVFRTDEDGTVTFFTDGERLWLDED